MSTPFPVKKGQVIEAGEGNSFTAKRDGMAYWDGDVLRMSDAHTPAQAAEKAIREAPVAAYLVSNLRSGEPSLCFEDERGDYGDEDHTPVFDELVLKSDAEAQLAELRAEVERLREVFSAAEEALELTRIHGSPRLPRLFSAVENARCGHSGG